MMPPLVGLVLAGGFSRRMGRDKALMSYHGTPQYVWTARLLEACCSEVMISCREGQLVPAESSDHYVRLHDRVEGQGPITGILAAMEARPDAAILAVACDLPRLTASTIKHLVDSRDHTKLATCFRSEREPLPEPMCAIYEPAMKPVFEQALSRDVRCPRKVLIQSGDRVQAFPVREPGALDNANSPADFAAAGPELI